MSNGEDQGGDPHRIGVSSDGLGLAPQAGIGDLGPLQVEVGHEDQLAPSSGEPRPPGALAGLDDHRVALRGSRHGERSPAPVVLALVVEPMHPVAPGEQPGLAVEDQGEGLIARVEADHDVHPVLEAWEPERQEFLRRREGCLLY